jgi:hypothetical protein
MIEQLMPDVCARITPGASNLPNMDNPDDFDLAIMRFLEMAR